MDQSIAEDWANRLEAKREEQGRFYLCRNGKYCCLGVLSEMAVEAGIITKEQGEQAVVYDGRDATLPAAVMAWADMKTGTGELFGGTLMGQHLTALNDHEDWGFVDIAELIRTDHQYL